MSLKYKIPFFCPEYKKWPEYFNKSSHEKSIDTKLIYPYHDRFNYEAFERNFGVNSTFYFTIFRNPIDVWKSALLYYPRVNLDSYEELKGFLKDLMKIKEEKNYERLKDYSLLNLFFNPLTFELGFDHLKDNLTKIIEIADFVKNTFNIVLFKEYFNESMILLKNTLCLDYDDIIYVKMNQNIPRNTTVLDIFLQKNLKKIQSLLKMDNILYKIALKNFLSKIINGFDDYNHYVEKNAEIYALCIEGRKIEIAFDYVHYYGYELKENLETSLLEFCSNLVTKELTFSERICNNQL